MNLHDLQIGRRRFLRGSGIALALSTGAAAAHMGACMCSRFLHGVAAAVQEEDPFCTTLAVTPKTDGES